MVVITGLGEVIIPNRNHHGLRGSRHYQVESVHGEVLRLSCGGQVTEVNLSQLGTPLAAEVYLTQSVPLAIGDKLQWTKNNHRLGRVNGQEVYCGEGGPRQGVAAGGE